MIGLVVIGPHARLLDAYKTAYEQAGLKVSTVVIVGRLAELDYVHPRDFKKVLEGLPETLVRWTNNPAVLDAVPAERICVLTEDGPKPFKSLPRGPCTLHRFSTATGARIMGASPGMPLWTGLPRSMAWILMGDWWEKGERREPDA